MLGLDTLPPKIPSADELPRGRQTLDELLAKLGQVVERVSMLVLLLIWQTSELGNLRRAISLSL
jgi:hypothetical protein